MQRQVIHHVQVLRFIAASGVVLSHIGALLIPNVEAHQWFWAVPWTAGVHLFFVISGFIMLLLTQKTFGAKGAATDFLKRRAIRIVPPYWFFTTLTVAAVLASGGRLGGTTVDLPQALTSYTFIPWPRADGLLKPIVAQGWTLNYEAFFYVAFTLALLTRRGIFALSAAFVLLAAAYPVVPASHFMLKFWTNPIILEFLAGIALARIYVAGVRLPLAGSWGLAALGVAILFVHDHGRTGFLASFIHMGIPAILLSASLILAPEPAQIGILGRMLQAGGDASYTIYLAHYMVVHAFALLWGKLGIGMPWLGIAIGMAAAIIPAVIFYYLVERPITRTLQRRAVGRRSAELESVAP